MASPTMSQGENPELLCTVLHPEAPLRVVAILYSQKSGFDDHEISHFCLMVAAEAYIIYDLLSSRDLEIPRSCLSSIDVVLGWLDRIIRNDRTHLFRQPVSMHLKNL